MGGFAAAAERRIPVKKEKKEKNSAVNGLICADVPLRNYPVTFSVFQGGIMTCDRAVTGSTDGRYTFIRRLWASCSHTCATISHQAV